MGPRASLALAVLSSLLLIGCAGEEGAYNTADLGASVDLSGNFCSSTLSIEASPAPATPGGTIYAPADLIATATPNTSFLEKPVWSGVGPDGSPFSPEVIDTSSGLRARYHAESAGSYTFRVDFVQARCFGEKSQLVAIPDAKVVEYRFRVSPPTTLGIPQQDLKINVKGMTPNAAEDLNLSKGDMLSATLRGPGNTAIAGEVRLLADNAPEALAVAGTNGLFTVAISNSLEYTPLLIPKDPLLAPRLLTKTSGLSALSGLSFTVDAGDALSGTVKDAADAALPGVKVVLRSGKLPSGVGVSAANGSYSLRAQTGSFTASIGADGWPELSATATVPSTLDVKYLVTRMAAAATVVDSGNHPVAGARVTVHSPVIASAANVNGQPVTGRLKQVVISAADGSLPGLQLVTGVGNYDVLVEPPAGSDGVTHLSLAAAATWSLPLLAKIVLGGKVTDRSGVAVSGVKVTAFETAGLGAAPTTISKSDGSFTITVDAGSPLEVLFEPPAASNLSSLRQVVAAGSTQMTAALPTGLRIGGSVLQGTSKLPFVVVEALCGSCGSDAPLASAISDSSGGYALYLPDPGLGLGDGGVNDASP